MSARTPRLLLGTAGTGTTWGILMSLRERWGDQVHVVGTDMLPAHLVAASDVCDAFYQVPAVSDPKFTTLLSEIIAAEGIDTYLPTFDGEIVLASTLRDQGGLEGVDLLAPAPWAAETCWDKAQAAAWLDAYRLPTPRTQLLSEATFSGDGVIIKPRRGVGSVGVERVHSEKRLRERQREADADDYIVQELLDGPELTLDCFLSRDGITNRVLCRERVEVKAGVSTKARVFEGDEHLVRNAIAVGRGLDLKGSYCLQVMPSPDGGKWLITDVNPRTGAGTRLSVAAGVDFLAATLADAWGYPVKDLLPALAREEIWVARQYREVVVG